MDPITPTSTEGQGVIFAKDQPEYIPLPAKVTADGRVITEWQLSEEERNLIARGENIRLYVHRFPKQCPSCGLLIPVQLQPLEPVRLAVTTPEGD